MKTSKLLVLAALCAASAVAAPTDSASLSVTLNASHMEFVRGEALRFTGEVGNAGPAALIIDDYGPYVANSLKLFVRNSETGRLVMPRQNAPASVVGELMLTAGASKPYEADLRDFFDLPPGRYTATAAIYRGEEVAASVPVSFTIVEGIELRAVLHAGKGRGDRPLRYALLYWGRERREDLFLRITDPAAGGALRASVALGGLVRVADPSLTFKDDELTVVHQTGRDRFSQTRFDVSTMPPRLLERNDNLLSADALHERIATRLVEERVVEAAARREREEGGLFQRHRTRVPEPTEQPSAIHPVPKD